ncbi:MAG: tetratricopeptide repeat protein [Nitrospiria bacterium]
MKPPGRFSSVSQTVLLVLAGALIFSNVFQNSFHLDDFHTILYNDNIHSLKNTLSFFTSGNGFSGTPAVSGYRPVTVSVNALNYAVSRTSPAGYHLVNLLLHLVCSILVWRIAFQLSLNKTVGFLSGLFFLIHPMNTEVVNYISSRSSSLSALFYLAAFSAFIQYRKQSDTRWLMLSLLIFLLALLSKEVAVTLPLLLISYDTFYRKPLTKRHKAGVYLAFCAMVILFLSVRNEMMTGAAQDRTISSVSPNIRETARNILTGSLYLSTEYLRLYFFPYPLTADHPFPKLEPGPLPILFLLFWIFTGILLIVFRRQKIIPFLASWFIITLLPVFLLPGITTLSVFQENRGYLSGAGIIILMVWILIKIKDRLTGKYPLFTCGFAAIFLFAMAIFSYESYLRNQDWKTEVTLWDDACRKNPSSFIANFSLGFGYLKEKNLDQALYFFNQSLKLTPPGNYLYSIHNNLGSVYYLQGNNKKSFEEYLTAKKLSPHSPEVHINLALVYLKEGDYRKAEEELLTDMDINYRHMEQRVLAAIEIEQRGAIETAGPLLIKIMEHLPKSPEYENIHSLAKEHIKKYLSLR